MPLCQSCLDFDIQCFAPGKPLWRGFPTDDINKGNEMDCEFCAMLFSGLVKRRSHLEGGRWVHITAFSDGPKTEGLNIAYMDAMIADYHEDLDLSRDFDLEGPYVQKRIRLRTMADKGKSGLMYQ